MSAAKIMSLAWVLFLSTTSWTAFGQASAITLPSPNGTEPAVFNTTARLATKHTVEFPAGLNTFVRLSSYQEGNFVSAPDVYMSCTYGLYRLSQRIPARGLKSSLLMDERVVEVGSSKLKIRDSDSSPYFMTIGYMTDLLYGLSEALHSALWNVEADIEIWDRTTRHHVGHGTLENRYTPRQAAGTTSRGNGTATAR